MVRSYTPITLAERCQMAHVHAEGHSLRQITATLERAPSTVATFFPARYQFWK